MNLLEDTLAYGAGPIIATAGTILAAWVARRGSVKAAEITRSGTPESFTIDGYHKLVTDLQTEVNRIGSDLTSLRKDHDELNTHVQRLEDQAKRDKSLIRHLVAYIHRLRNEIVSLGGKVPEPTPSLAEHITEAQEASY